MLLELTIGDAYGGGFENVRDRKFINKNNTLIKYVKHPKHASKPGAYTDVKQMSIAIAELIVFEPNWTPEIIANHFLNAFHRDRRAGYAGGFFLF